MLDEHVITMTTEAEMLRYEVSRQKERGTRLAYVMGVVIVFGALMLMLMLWNRATLTKVQFTQEYLIECTTPGPRTPTSKDYRTGNACYDRGTERTNAAVETLIDALSPPTTTKE